MSAVVAAFNQEKALVEAFFVITNLHMEVNQPTLDSTNAPQLELLNFIAVHRNSIKST